MFLNLSKLFYALLILYYGWFQIIFFSIPNLLLILGAGMMFFIFLNALQTRNLRNAFTMELKMWILFAVTSFVYGLFVAVNHGNLISSIFTFSQFLVLMYGIIYISDQDRTIDFFIIMFIVYAMFCAITTVFWGVEYGQGRISMGLANNPNTLGMTMAIGVCCVLFKHSFEKLIISVFAFSSIILMIYVILLTGSRKAFLSIALIIIYWLIFIVFKDIKAFKFTTKLKGILSVVLVIGTGYYMLYPFFKDSVLLQRLLILFESGNATREGMYSVAVDLFIQNPLVGIGFNNYRVVSMYETYSHSTYAEALACTGIIGSILYFSSYILILVHFWKLLKSNLDALFLRQAKVMLGLFSVLLFAGIGVIHFYTMTSSIAFGMLIAFYNVNLRSLKN